ncbi:glutathione S-transferase [Mycotypha africana]|uniref:glutathione S-transferase n=1 Tax=Mycotypha africana TaxID=64632 RepID=UPI0022FFDCC6|nr:glutathione S-transferase [Mycotypha africana]KAI8969183.1 glutathione S-transferase [Mycotypha africana]
MSSSDKITLYNAVICPYAQRAHITLREVDADFDIVDIDLLNKPEWYKEVNPELKVPTLTTEGQNLAESLIIIEYLNDRFPEKNLMPKKPLLRANVRFAIEWFGSKVNPHLYKCMLKFNDADAADAIEDYKKNTNAALASFNDLLMKQSEKGPYFLGEDFSLADIAIAPFLLRIFSFNDLFLDGYRFEAIESHPRLAQFIEGISSRPSIKDTYCGNEKYADILARKYNVKKN